MFWQESVGYVPSSGKLNTLKGMADIEIEDGKVTDLEEVRVRFVPLPARSHCC
jgi:hypothetical protein